MQKDYQTPEAVEIGKADLIILGSKDDFLWDGLDLTFNLPEMALPDRDE